jgi:colanic acid/amylovoran biosynthesis glycosyltransferase
MTQPLVTMIHSNPVSVADGVLRVDRKFHHGMLAYVAGINAKLVTANPLILPGQAVMDPVSVPLADLPYQVIGLPVDAAQRVLPGEHWQQLEQHIAASALLYGASTQTREVALAQGVPYVSVLEYDLHTHMVSARSSAPNKLKGVSRALRCVVQHWKHALPEMRQAKMLHCNGYPIYNASAPHNTHRLLYLDSRMRRDDVIAEAALEQRLAHLGSRPLRLLYSGRYEAMKGALDAVQSAVHCLRAGLDVEMDCYGQGRLAAAMRKAAAAYPDRLRVHDVIPFPELVARSKQADLFVCCHVQSDPSCTYLESMGSGLPVVGYGNRMWAAMQADSNAGWVSRKQTPASVAQAIAAALSQPGELAAASRRARSFAVEHCFENEFAKRMDSINNLIG